MGFDLSAYQPQALADRFDKFVAPDPNSGCWLWIGATRYGYGRFSKGRKNFLAHRFSYELHKGQIPEGLQLDHLCRTRGCVNPDHLEPVTAVENGRRGKYAEDCKLGRVS